METTPYLFPWKSTIAKPTLVVSLSRYSGLACPACPEPSRREQGRRVEPCRGHVPSKGWSNPLLNTLVPPMLNISGRMGGINPFLSPSGEPSPDKSGLAGGNMGLYPPINTFDGGKEGEPFLLSLRELPRLVPILGTCRDCRGFQGAMPPGINICGRAGGTISLSSHIDGRQSGSRVYPASHGSLNRTSTPAFSSWSFKNMRESFSPQPRSMASPIS